MTVNHSALCLGGGHSLLLSWINTAATSWPVGWLVGWLFWKFLDIVLTSQRKDLYHHAWLLIGSLNGKKKYFYNVYFAWVGYLYARYMLSALWGQKKAALAPRIVSHKLPCSNWESNRLWIQPLLNCWAVSPALIDLWNCAAWEEIERGQCSQFGPFGPRQSLNKYTALEWRNFLRFPFFYENCCTVGKSHRPMWLIRVCVPCSSASACVWCQTDPQNKGLP